MNLDIKQELELLKRLPIHASTHSGHQKHEKPKTQVLIKDLRHFLSWLEFLRLTFFTANGYFSTIFTPNG